MGGRAIVPFVGTVAKRSGSWRMDFSRLSAPDVMRKALGYARLPPRALQANGFTVVRFGILPPQSRFRVNDDDGI
ncbi:MAG: hypothetical protein EPN36_01965 [Rhodanobacteraceae bacterium]|nr:MAG: hypothetical protein EPN36_01965 [Rhodanobacteraceae bacterium]